MKKFLVIAAAAGALAFGVPAAIAATETPATTAQPTQSQQERPQRDDCPEKNAGAERSSAEI